MLPTGILETARTSLANPAASKKRVLEEAAQLLAAGYNIPTQDQVFEKLLERERLGSTGLAHGVALPHARMQGVNSPRGAFLRLQNGVDFDAMDGQPVDLVFALLVPEEATQAHLDLLASLAGLFGDKALCEQARQLSDPESLIALFTSNHATPDNGSEPVRRPA